MRSTSTNDEWTPCVCMKPIIVSVVVIDYSIIVRHIVVIAILALWLWIWYCGVNDNIDCIH